MLNQWKGSLVLVSMLAIGSVFLTGCADMVVYQPNLNLDQRPAMSMSQAIGEVRIGLLSMTYNNVDQDIVVTPIGFSLITSGNRVAVKYTDFTSFDISQSQDDGYYYLPFRSDFWMKWSNLQQAQDFIQALGAMVYYAKNTAIDTPETFALFQQKAAEWRSLSPKPVLPEELRRYRVLADDAITNKEFDKAAEFYEQGLDIDPLWPSGQYNAAMLYSELQLYPMAVMHMKRYLALKPDAADARASQDKLYIWQEKVNEDNQKMGIANNDQGSASQSNSNESLFFMMKKGD